MIRADLVNAVHEKHGGISYEEANEIVVKIIDTIVGTLASGESVKLTGFGTLSVINRKPKLGRNPQTGDRLLLKANRHITFRPSRNISFD